MPSALNAHEEAWELDWVNRLIVALSSVQGDPSTPKFIDDNTQVQFGKFPVVKGLNAAMPFIGSVYGLASGVMKKITRVHIYAPADTIYVSYTVHITAKGDPDAKEVLIPTVLVVQKPLGKNQENVKRLEVYNDWTPFLEWARQVGTS